MREVTESTDRAVCARGFSDSLPRKHTHTNPCLLASCPQKQSALTTHFTKHLLANGGLEWHREAHQSCDGLLGGQKAVAPSPPSTKALDCT